MDGKSLSEIIGRKGYGIESAFGKGNINSQVLNAGEGSDMERGSGHEPVREKKTTINYSGQCIVRIKVYRRRLCDPDGNCLKYHIDFLRYIGAIKEDNASAIRLVFEGQEKVSKDEEERCEITVEYPDVDFDNFWTKE